MYEEIIKSKEEKLQTFQTQVLIFEKLCEDGNMFISLEEMNAIDVIKKLGIVEKDPKTIWKALE